eukprot:CAMPEP_0182881342 /NCGR_PEP_ID=MMETSP0034_2-20130328/17121_1 /TAXON_ID=156128 /ORGANISM="Nephroselmis pyriformis, Strain CCMP717" /LENGTH=96 /DNA_ID=CAMNT_0025014371 /DNA_START=108 /DNA_END=398 /DNA_ORIENTATION=-
MGIPCGVEGVPSVWWEDRGEGPVEVPRLGVHFVASVEEKVAGEHGAGPAVRRVVEAGGLQLSSCIGPPVASDAGDLPGDGVGGPVQVGFGREEGAL